LYLVVPIKLTMLKLLTSIFILVITCTIESQAQSGCTDPWAINFNPDAVSDDGSCEVFITTYVENTTISIPINIGTGISSDHAHVAYHGPLELALKVNERFVDDIVPEGIEYYALTGYSPTSFFDQTPDVGIATWDYVFSIDLGDYELQDLVVNFTIDFDPLEGEAEVEAYTLLYSELLTSIGQGGLSLKQGAENLGFGYWQGLAGEEALLFDPLNPGVYDIGLQTYNLAGNQLIDLNIVVIVEDPIQGCTDSEACNFDPLANLDDGSCLFGADCACAGDLDFNGIVGGTDLLVFLSFYGGPCDCDADFTGNGVVTIEDLLTFLSYYGNSCID
jgi:hypothetical protein